MEKERKVAIEILDEFEEMLGRKGIRVPSDDRALDEQEVTQACLYGHEYYELEDTVTAILKQSFRQKGKKKTEAQEEGFFPITSVHRDDIKEAVRLTDEQVARITDDMMREIAQKMADDYLEQLYWEHLPVIAEYVAEREGIDLSGKEPPEKSDQGSRKRPLQAPCLLTDTGLGGV